MFKYIMFLVIVYQSCFGQLKTYTFEQVDTSLTIDKPIIVFLNTKWCRSCRLMKKTTLKDSLLIEELNKNYHFIAFDAESKNIIKFKNKTYKFKSITKRRGIHELAELLGKYKHRISYPTTVFLNLQKEVVFRSTQRMKAKGFLRLLKELKEHEKI